MIGISLGSARKFLAIFLMALPAAFGIYLKYHPGWEFTLNPAGFARSDYEGVYSYSLPSLARSRNETYASFIDYSLLKHALRSSQSRCEALEDGRPLTYDAGLGQAPGQPAPGKFHRVGGKLYLTSGDGGHPGENHKIYRIRLSRGVAISDLSWFFLLSLPLLSYPMMKKLSPPDDKNIIPPAAKYIYLFILALQSLTAARFLYSGFPNIYSWGELFINYEGGFVRRGLLGQSLFLAARVMPIAICYPALYAFIFGVFLYIVHKKLTGAFDRLTTAFIFLSPAMLLMPIRDVNIFGRKDLFIEITLLAIASVCVNCLKKEDASLFRNTSLICVFFIIGALIHEAIIFYFPLFMVLLGAVYARRNKIFGWLCLAGALFTVIPLLLAVIFVGDVGIRDAISNSWKAYYPDFQGRGGLSFIGVSPYDITFNMTLPYLTNLITMASTGLGACLGGLPLLFLWLAYRPYAAVRELLSASRLLRLAFWPAAAAPWLFLAVIDYGRAVSFALVSYLFFLYAVLAARPQPAAPWLNRLKEKIRASPRWRCSAYIFAILYGLGWRMHHVRSPGKSFVDLDPHFFSRLLSEGKAVIEWLF